MFRANMSCNDLCFIEYHRYMFVGHVQGYAQIKTEQMYCVISGFDVILKLVFVRTFASNLFGSFVEFSLFNVIKDTKFLKTKNLMKCG